MPSACAALGTEAPSTPSQASAPASGPWACGRLEVGGRGEELTANPLLTTRSPLFCQNPAAPLLGHALLCSSSGANPPHIRSLQMLPRQPLGREEVGVAALWTAGLGLGTELDVPTTCSKQDGRWARVPTSHYHARGHLPPAACPTPGPASRSSIHTLPSLPTRQHPSGLCHCQGVGQAHFPAAPATSCSPGPSSHPVRSE